MKTFGWENPILNNKIITYVKWYSSGDLAAQIVKVNDFFICSYLADASNQNYLNERFYSIKDAMDYCDDELKTAGVGVLDESFRVLL